MCISVQNPTFTLGLARERNQAIVVVYNISEFQGHSCLSEFVAVVLNVQCCTVVVEVSSVLFLL